MGTLNYRHLECFWMAAQEGSLTRAAEKLGVVVSTVSAQISALEEELGTSLFHRRGRHLELTDAGRTVAHYATDIFGLGTELVALLDRDDASAQAVHVHVGVAHDLPKLVAYRLLEPLVRRDPPAHLVVHHERPERLAADLQTRRFDVVLSDAPVQLSARAPAQSTAIGSSALTLVAAPALRDRMRPGFPASLEGAPILLPSSGSATRRDLDAWMAERDLRPQVVGEFDDSALLKVFGSHGAGAFVVPTVVLDEVAARYDAHPVGVFDGVETTFYVTELVARPRPDVVDAMRSAALA